MPDWPRELARMELEVSGDPYSSNGEEDEVGFDDMPVENGWDDESEEDDEEAED